MVYQRALPITSCHQPPIFHPPMVLQLMITFPRKIFPSTKLLSIKPPPPPPLVAPHGKDALMAKLDIKQAFQLYQSTRSLPPLSFGNLPLLLPSHGQCL